MCLALPSPKAARPDHSPPLSLRHLVQLKTMMGSPFRQRVLRAAALIALMGASACLVVGLWFFAPPRLFTLDLGDPATHVSNFYGIEKSDDRSFRWSHSFSAFSLPALASSQVVSITLNPARAPEGSRLKFKLLVGEEVVGDFQVQPGWQTYTATLGPGLRPDLRLYMESDTFYPDQRDDRRLGMAVSTVSTAPQPGSLGAIMPPRLWLLVALLLPLLAYGLGNLLSRKVGWFAAAVAPLLTLTLTGFSPLDMALPLASWLFGLAAILLFFFWSYRWSRIAGGPFDRLRKIARSKWELPLLSLFLLALTVVQTWPMITKLRTELPGWPSDNFAFLYKLWWFRTALLVTHESPLFDPNAYSPYGFNLAQGEVSYLNTIPGVPLGALFGDVAAYNLLSLLWFVVGGIGGYLLVREITGSRGAALLASIAFAFCSHTLGHYAGHLQFLGTGWIALTFYFLERMFRTRSVKSGALAGLCFALVALGAWYYGYMVGLAVALFVVLRLWSVRHDYHLRSLWKPVLAALVVVVAIAGPAVLPSLEIWSQGGLRRSAAAADEFSASPTDYLIPNQLHPIWGDYSMRLQSDRPVYEASLYLGFVSISIALIGWALTRRRAKQSGPTTAPWGLWLVMLVFVTVLSFGLTLHGLRGQVEWTDGTDVATIPMPASILYDWLPFFSSMRSYARFGVLAALALAVLMGLGWASICRYGGTFAARHGMSLLLLAVTLLLFDVLTVPFKWGSSPVRPTVTSAFLNAAPEGSVMQMPLSGSRFAPAQSGPSLYWGTYYHQPITYGWDSYDPPHWRAAQAALESFPDRPALDVLRKWDVRYIVVNKNAYAQHWPEMDNRLRTTPALQFLVEFDEPRGWIVDPAVLDAYSDLEAYAQPDTQVVYELLP
jgi:hypothetical protein